MKLAAIWFAHAGTCLLLAGSAALAATPDDLTSARSLLGRIATDNQRPGTTHPTMAPIGVMPGGAVAEHDPIGMVIPPDPGGWSPDDPPAQQLRTGPFVSFEVPVTKGLELNSTGTRLYALNEPNNTIEVIETTGTRLKILNHIPVGLGPVTIKRQPGTELLWVANYISDNVSIVDPAIGATVSVVEVGDRPVNIVFDADGSHAFVVCEGSALIPDANAQSLSSIIQEGALVAVDTASRNVVQSLWLDCNTPRAAAYDPVSQSIYVAAAHSGNNTTVVGEPLRFKMDNIPDTDPNGFDFSVWSPILIIPYIMPSLADAWGSPLLSPWPDGTIMPLPGGELSDLTHRIVSDAGHAPDVNNFPWQEIVDRVSLPNGAPDPAAVLELETTWEALFAAGGTPVELVNADEVIAGLIDDAKDTDDFDIRVVNANSGSAGWMTITGTIEDVGTELGGMAMDPSGSFLLVTNLEANNLTRLNPSIRGNVFDHQVVKVTSPSVAPLVARHDLHAGVPNFDDVSAPNPTAQANALAIPLDVVFNTDGDRAYVAAMGSGRIGILDGNANVLGLRDVGGEHSAPRSLAFDGATDSLYVLDRTNMTVTRLNTGADALTLQDALCLQNPEPLRIRSGRKFLYSTRFTNNYSSSCATCHPNAHMDMLAWDLGDPNGSNLLPKPHTMSNGNICLNNETHFNHPIKGPMVTLSLRGLDGRDPFHWRGDKPQFVDFNEAFVNLLGAEQELSDEDMQAYSDFIMEIAYQPPFYRNRDNSYKDPAALNAIDAYAGSCAACHQLDDGGAMREDCAPQDIALDVFGAGLFAQVELVTQLRGINEKFEMDRYTGFGFIHDGREERNGFTSSLEMFLAQFFPALHSAGQTPNMLAFLSAFETNVMPCVGEQFMWANAGDAAQENRLLAMIDQHDLAPSRCDVVLSGKVGTRVHGYHMLSGGATPMFQSDTDQLLTYADIKAIVAGGDALMVTAVPPGSGKRIGIDWDRDCTSNGLDTQPLVPLADVNDDGKTDLFELNTVLLNFGKVGSAKLEEGDLTGDCNIDLVDLNVVLHNFGRVCVF
ncbi:MAG: hypothetical protein KDA20_10590 [Phycisphaerales bacterium]|nr:hypothetical protein [Phycisphaerales bacterium]